MFFPAVDWESLGTSLGAGAVIGAALTAALRVIWGKMWEKIDARDVRCEACSKAHEEKLHEVYGLVIQTLKDAAHEPPPK